METGNGIWERSCHVLMLQNVHYYAMITHKEREVCICRILDQLLI